MIYEQFFKLDGPTVIFLKEILWGLGNLFYSNYSYEFLGKLTFVRGSCSSSREPPTSFFKENSRGNTLSQKSNFGGGEMARLRTCSEAKIGCHQF